jgi:response regulator NasT
MASEVTEALQRVGALVEFERAGHRWKCVPIEDLALICASATENSELRTERDRATQRLADRTLIDRAKGMLMDQRQLTEDAAYHFMRRVAMNRGKRLVEIARAVLETPSDDALPSERL